MSDKKNSEIASISRIHSCSTPSSMFSSPEQHLTSQAPWQCRPRRPHQIPCAFTLPTPLSLSHLSSSPAGHQITSFRTSFNARSFPHSFNRSLSLQHARIQINPTLPVLFTPLCKAGPKVYPEDYDRDYYPALKEEYANDDQVIIYAKEDYELDPLDVPWLEENRGRDLKKIRHQLQTEPPVPGELQGLPSRPMRCTDLHTEDELESFESRMRYEDSVSGQIWEDPMPESDFEGDPQWIDFRKMDTSHAEDHDPEDVLASLPNPPRKRVQYASYEDELAAVQESMERMQAQYLDEDSTPTAWGEQHTVPDPEEFSKWQYAARARGGNSSQGNSFYLSPAKSASEEVCDVMDGHDGEKELRPPHQFGSLKKAHLGKWRGKIFVIAVLSDSKFGVRQGAEFDVQSDTSVEDGGGLGWTSVLTTSSECELVSHVTFERPEHEDALVPGRGVSSDGNYVCNALHCCGSNGTVQHRNKAEGLSLSSRCLKALIGDKGVRGELELCILSGLRGSNKLRRDRVLLCSVFTEKVAKGRRSSTGERRRHFSHIVLISEYQISNSDAKDNIILSQFTRANRSTNTLLKTAQGKWSGSAQLLQPEFPPVGFKEHVTSFTFQESPSISLDSVTWTEQDIPEVADTTSNARIRTLGKKKVSKRVATARAHDQRRLSECSFLSEEQVVDMRPETFAWKEVHDERGLTGLFSPRIGKFVNDYCGVFLPGGTLLTFPHSNAFPDMANTVCLVELTTPQRKRINVARNQAGTIVGALFITENLVEGDLCDDVASYV